MAKERDVNELEERIATLLELTAPEGPLEGFGSSELAPVLGVLWRARSLLEGLLVLYRVSAEGFGGEILSRAIFEHAITGVWVLQDLDERARRFVQDGNRQLAVLAERDPWFQRDLDRARDRWAASRWARASFCGALPNLKQRLVGTVRADPYYYMWYRYLSWLAHPSIVTVRQQLEKTPGGVVIRQRPVDYYSEDRLILPFAGLMYAWLVLEVERKTPGLFGGALTFEEMVTRLFDLMQQGPPFAGERDRAQPTKTKPTRPAGEQDELGTLVQDLLRLTGPPPATTPVPGLDEHWLWPVLGLLMRTHRLVTGLQTLYQSRALAFGGEVIARAVFEHAATGMWILENPDERLRRFVQSGNREVSTAAREIAEPWLAATLADAQERWNSSEWAADKFTRRLPSVYTRLVGPLKEYQKYYTWYRYLSAWAHPSLLAINYQWENRERGVVVHTRAMDRYTDGRLTLPFAGMSYWAFAVQWAGQLNLEPEYLELLVAMGAYLNRSMRDGLPATGH